MNYNKIFGLLIIIGQYSCSESIKSKIEYRLDRAGNTEYKEFEYQYILGSDSNGNKIEIRQGITREFYSNGQLRGEINFENGKVNGELKKYFENGQIAEISNWKNDTLSGLAKYYYNNGGLYQECNYLNGKLNGEKIIYHENGIARVRLQYKNDLLWQVKANYDSLGRKLDELTIESGTGVLNTYYPNGTIKSITEFKEGKPNGKSTWYFESGNEQAIFYLVNGQKEGNLKFLHENGKTARESNYKNDFLIGTEKVFDENGRLISEVTYKQNLTQKDIEILSGEFFSTVSDVLDPFGLDKGIRNGPYKTYYDNGKIESEQYYSDGLQDSIFREYYENGLIKTDIFFDDNYESNKRYERRYNKDGKLKKSETFKMTELAEKEKELKKLFDSKTKD